MFIDEVQEIKGWEKEFLNSMKNITWAISASVTPCLVIAKLT